MDNIYDVVRKNRCMSCGGCSTICPVKALNMKYIEKDGLFRPIIQVDRCIKCGKCLEVCPAIQKSKESLLGNYYECYLAHSSDISVRHNSTSGGVINELVRYILKKEIVDGVIMVKKDETSCIESEASFFTKKDLKKLYESPRDYASRYVSVPVLLKMSDMQDVKRIAVVGTPCQIESISRIEAITQCNILKIGITCSGGMSYRATSEFKRIMKMPNSKMYYRGDGWPGKNQLYNGKEIVVSNHNGSLFERMYSSQIFKNPGCRYCNDHFAEEADVSFCDFWNTGERKREKDGNSTVIIRSEYAKKILDDMLKEGVIQRVLFLAEEDVINTQKRVLAVKKGNINSKLSYQLYMSMVKLIYKSHIYILFRKNMYSFLCKIYYHIIKNNK